MTDLTDFLLDQIADDRYRAEAAAERAWPDPAENDTDWAWHFRYRPQGRKAWSSSIVEGAPSPARVLAECEAKRRIVTRALAAIRLSNETPDDESPSSERIHGYATALEEVLQQLVTVWADDPDCDESWTA